MARTIAIPAPKAPRCWLCEPGDASTYGEYDSFKTAIKSASLTANANALTITYNSPSQGMLKMSWNGAVLHNGVAVPLTAYDRYENPWSHTALPADDVRFTYGDSYLQLDFDSQTRVLSENVP